VVGELSGMKIAIIATDGVEQVELTTPRGAVEAAGAEVELLAPRSGAILGLNHIDKGDTFTVDMPVAQADPTEYAALLLPGGVVNADDLRRDRAAQDFVGAMFQQHKPVAVICHGPWILVEVDAVRGRTITSYPSIQTDLRNAGATWVDEEVHVEDRLVSSRSPADLPAFCTAILDVFARPAGTSASRMAGTSRARQLCDLAQLEIAQSHVSAIDNSRDSEGGQGDGRVAPTRGD
jgi:protease I